MKIGLVSPAVKPNPTNREIEEACGDAIVATTDFFTDSPIRIGDEPGDAYLRYGDRIFKLKLSIEFVEEVSESPVKFNKEI